MGERPGAGPLVSCIKSWSFSAVRESETWQSNVLKARDADSMIIMGRAHAAVDDRVDAQTDHKPVLVWLPVTSSLRALQGRKRQYSH
jgi:hypothetical protein